jgi:FAD synthase
LSLNPLNILKALMRHHGSVRFKKVEYLTELGVDYIAIAKFDEQFRGLSAQQFADLLHLNSMHSN